MPKTIDKPDSPKRCQGAGRHGGQCWNERQEGSSYCEVCASRFNDDIEGVKKQWLVEQFERRLQIPYTPGEEIKLLEENIRSINALIAARQALVVDPGSLLANAAPIAQLLQTSEKINVSLHKLRKESDDLLSKEALIRFGQRAGSMIASKLADRFDGWEDTVLEISDALGQLIVEATNKEPEDDETDDE